MSISCQPGLASGGSSLWPTFLLLRQASLQHEPSAHLHQTQVMVCLWTECGLIGCCQGLSEYRGAQIGTRQQGRVLNLAQSRAAQAGVCTVYWCSTISQAVFVHASRHIGQAVQVLSRA